MENYHLSIHIAFWKESMINRLSNLINRNRSAAKISQVLCSSDNAVAIVHMTRWQRPWCTICWWGKKTPALTGIQRWTGEGIFLFFHKFIYFQVRSNGNWLCTQQGSIHGAFLETPQSCIFREGSPGIWWEKKLCLESESGNNTGRHYDIYRLIWSPAKDRTVGLWAGFMVVIQVIIIILSWLLSQWSVTLVI